MSQTSFQPPSAGSEDSHVARARRLAPRRRLRGRRKPPPPASQAGYLARAEACLAAAAATSDPVARRLHEEECGLWLILARQRQGIEDVLRRYVEDAAG